jgi:hypothetical protein
VLRTVQNNVDKRTVRHICLHEHDSLHTRIRQIPNDRENRKRGKNAVGRRTAGAGFGLVLVIVGFFVWRSSRPTSLLPWNKSAIKASMVNFDLLDFYPATGAQNTSSLPEVDVTYEFDILNTTGADYTLDPPRQSVVAMQKLKSSGALIDGSGLIWRPLKGSEEIAGQGSYADRPILLPPGQAVRVVFILTYQYLDGSGSNNKSPSGDQLDQFGRDQSKDIGGFVLLDQVNHYQIDLPIDETKIAPVNQTAKSPMTNSNGEWTKSVKDPFDPLDLFKPEEKAGREVTTAAITQVATQYGVPYSEAWEKAKSLGYKVPQKQ